MKYKFRKYLLKIATTSILDALVLFFCILFLLDNQLVVSIVIAIGTLLINWLTFSKRSYPLRYLLPGLSFMIAMVVLPIGYNI